MNEVSLVLARYYSGGAAEHSLRHRFHRISVLSNNLTYHY